NGFRLDGIDPGDASGVSVDGAGDINGDGIDDLILGADMAHPHGKERAGQSYVVFGTDKGFAASLDLSALDGTNGFRVNGIDVRDDSGWQVAPAGDVNADGIADVVIGAFRPDDFTGESYVVFGSGAGFAADLELSALDGTNGFRLHGVDPGDRLGWSVTGAGDVNGDGIDDLAVGGPHADPGGKLNAGESYVVFGTDAGFAASLEVATLDGTNGFRLDGISPRDYSGREIAGAGDVNGDGIGDLIIGARGGDPGGVSYAGESYVVFGFATGDGSERLVGTPGPDEISGFAGNDTIFGRAGDDRLFGNVGDDALIGGDGDDYLFGGIGADSMVGGGGDDWLRGWTGRDLLAGGLGNDTLAGEADSDTLGGGLGTDVLSGGEGRDSLVGGAGNDVLRGDDGSDTLAGGTGNDQLTAGRNDDRLRGEAGNDRLVGGEGADVFEFRQGGGTDHVADFGIGADRIDVAAFGFASGADVLALGAQDGSDAVFALGSGTRVVLDDHALADLSAGDFLV
ncbi:MAG TPA: hypothetical protein VM422_05155, partial [Amaricoccus sp.]|nr:hypothetical protein [Amaricoccus sp.]